MASATLPLPSANQIYVQVSPIPGGFITLSDHFFVHPATPGANRTVPSLTFLIQHPGTSLHGGSPSKPFRLMFDLGLRKDPTRYSAELQDHLAGRQPFDLTPGVAAQLQAGGLDPCDVDLVILSHVHYDHHGDPEDFPRARFRVGHGALDVLRYGLGGYASHQHFDPNTLPAERSGEFSNPAAAASNGDDHEWQPLGPFPAALDLFGDGSVYVIDTPGHLPGHVNLLCRTREKWICLCGDAFHDRRLLTGQKEIGTWEGPRGNTLCIHVDKDTAAESIRRLRKLQQSAGDNVEIVAAHEDIWWEKNQHKKFPATM